MTDELRVLRDRISAFANDRGWDRMRTLKDLSLALGIEAAELQEHFLWVKQEDERALVADRREEIEKELADVFIYCVAIAHEIDVDLVDIANQKMALNERRFPR